MYAHGFRQIGYVVFLAVIFAVTGVGCTLGQPVSVYKLNEIQVLGSHNSYKLAMDPELFAQLASRNSKLAMSLEYSHISLTEQLDLGVRALELDVYFDPEGGRYATPLSLSRTASASEYDPKGVMNKPGLKVLHVQDIDFRSSCLTFLVCLRELREWSEQNPGHLPIMVSVNAKDEVIELPGFVTPLKFQQQAWASLDAEILAGLSDKVILPKEIKGQAKTLNEAITTTGWPELSSLADRFFFVLDESEEKGAAYLSNQDNAVMFVNLPEGNPYSAIRILNNPVKDQQKIRDLVKQGYLVRTRADADTGEARNNNVQRREAAWASGAHFISTDYYQKPQFFDSPYFVEAPVTSLSELKAPDSHLDDNFYRCNPIAAEHDCSELP